MSRKTPTVATGGLHLPGETITIPLDSADWFAWLAIEDHHSFHFIDQSGGFTARKERKQRGQWYWVAYRQVQGKLYKSYIGKSETLTEAHLYAVAHTLTTVAAIHDNETS